MSTPTLLAAGLGSAGATPFLLTSNDGVTWTSVTTPMDGDASPFGLTAAVAPDKSSMLAGVANSTPTTGSILVSSDGVTWTVAENATLASACWCFLANGNWYAGVTAKGGSPILTSTTNGQSWTTVKTPWGNNSIVYALAFNGTLWLAGGNDATGSKVLMSSADGVSWQQVSTPWDSAGGFGFVDSIAWDSTHALWFAAGSNSAGNKILMTSPDGATWTNATTPQDAAGLGQWVFAKSDGTVMLGCKNTAQGNASLSKTTNGGTSWTQITMPWDTAATGRAITASIIWNAGLALWVAMGYVGSQVGLVPMATSPDASTWTTHHSAFDGDGATGVIAQPSGTLTRRFITPTALLLPQVLPDSSGLQKRLYLHYQLQAQGVTVFKLSDGTYVQDYPTAENSNTNIPYPIINDGGAYETVYDIFEQRTDYFQNPHVVFIYNGGHVHIVSSAEASALIAAGYGADVY